MTFEDRDPRRVHSYSGQQTVMPIDQIQTLPYASIDDRQRQPSSFDVFDSSYSNNYYQQSRIPPNQSCGQAIYYDYTPSRTPSLSQNVRLDQDIRQGPIMMTDPSSYGYEDMQDRRRGRRPAPAYGLWQPVQQPRYSGFQETYEHQPRGMMQGGFERPRIGNSGMPQPTTHQYFQDTRQEQGDYSANRNDISRGRDSRLSEELPRGSEFNNEHYSGQSLQENYTGLRRRQIMDLPHLHSQSRMSPEKVGRLHGNGQRGASLTLQPPSYPLGRDILHDGGNGFSLAQERARVNRQGLRYPGDPVTAMALPSRQNPGPSNSPRPSAAAVQSAIASGLNWDSWGLTENYLMETSDVPKKRAVFDVPKYQIAGFGEDSIDGHALEEDEESNSTITSLADEASQEGDGSNMSGSGQDFEVTAQGVAPGTKPEESNKKPRGTGSRGGIGSRGGKGSRGGIGSRRGKGSRGGMGSRGGKGAGGRPKKIRLAESDVKSRGKVSKPKEKAPKPHKRASARKEDALKKALTNAQASPGLSPIGSQQYPIIADEMQDETRAPSPVSETGTEKLMRSLGAALAADKAAEIAAEKAATAQGLNNA